MSTRAGVLNRAWLLLVVLCCAGLPSIAQEEAVPADQVKAVFIYNFLKFIRWPDTDRAEAYTVAIVGRSAITALLQEIASKRSVHGKPILVKQLSSADEIGHCHVLFIPREEEDNLQLIINSAKNRNILTVSEGEGLAEKGVGINLIRVGEKIQLEINKRATDREGLRVSPQLLTVATLVDTAPEYEHR